MLTSIGSLSLLTWLLILVVPYAVIGGLGKIAQLSFNGRPVRPSRRPVFARMAPAGGGWS